MQSFRCGLLTIVLASVLLSGLAIAAPAPQDQASGSALIQASAATNSTTTATSSAQPSAPQVIYQNGQLSISSENSTLREIFDAIHAQTGANIEGAALNDSSPVMGHFGPGSPQSVLTDLVYGTRFNLVIMTSPGKINRIVLSQQGSAREWERLVADDRIAAKAVEKSGRNSFGAAVTSRAEERSRPNTTADATPTNRPALPPGIPSEMWNLYPQLLQQNNGLSTPNPVPENLPALQNARNSQNTQPAAVSPPPGGYPALPRGIPPEMWTLYPPNIMQLIQNAGPPPAPAPRPTTVPTTLWDQALPVQH